MSNNPFVWSYPPGCSGPPDHDDQPCMICGLFPDDCICPECPTCEAYGDPKCYEEHGLVRSPEQIASLAKQEAQWAEENRRENEFWDQHYREVEEYQNYVDRREDVSL